MVSCMQTLHCASMFLNTSSPSPEPLPASTPVSLSPPPPPTDKLPKLVAVGYIAVTQVDTFRRRTKTPTACASSVSVEAQGLRSSDEADYCCGGTTVRTCAWSPRAWKRLSMDDVAASGHGSVGNSRSSRAHFVAWAFNAGVEGARVVWRL